MATYTDTLGFDKGSAAAFRDGGQKYVTRLSVELDFAEIVSARSAGSATALAATDVLEVIQLPAKTVVLACGIDVTSAETTNTTATIDVGDGDDPNGYVAAQASNAVASDASSGALGFTKYYGSADTIDITLGTAAPTDMVCKVWAVVANGG